MVDTQIQQTIVSLHAHTNVAALNAVDTAICMLLLPETPALDALHKQLQKRLKYFLTNDWLAKATLADACLLLQAALQSAMPVPRDLLAQLLQRIVHAEVAPGGPYIAEGVVDLITTARVAAFARATAQPLKKAEKFLAAQHTAQLALFDRITLAMCQLTPWPSASEQNQQKNGLWPDAVLTQNTRSCTLAVTTCQSMLLRQHANHDASLKVIAAVEAILADMPDALRQQLSRSAQHIYASSSAHEILLMPFAFATTNTPPELWQTLGAAMVFGWIAYNTYDTVLDEHTAISGIPAANTAMRLAQQLFALALPQNYVAQVFDRMDAANAWELSTCRATIKNQTITIPSLPHYSAGTVLAERSFGHALGALGILASEHPSDWRFAIRGFHHFLIARQLQDDLHDWLQDLQAGHISFVVAHILKTLRVQPGDYSLPTLISKCERALVNSDYAAICHTITQHCNKARKIFYQNNIQSVQLYQLLRNIEVKYFT